MRSPFFTSGIASILIVSSLVAAGCGGGLSGRVVRGDTSFVKWVDGGSLAADVEPIVGASITVTRDPQSPARQVVGHGVSQADGSFTLDLDAFGAGWMQEDWLIVAVRPGVGRAEYLGRIESGYKLLVTLAPGTDRGTSMNDLWGGTSGAIGVDSVGSFGKGDTGASLMEEAKHYGGKR